MNIFEIFALLKQQYPTATKVSGRLDANQLFVTAPNIIKTVNLQALMVQRTGLSCYEKIDSTKPALLVFSDSGEKKYILWR